MRALNLGGLLLLAATVYAVDGGKAKYVGGTLPVKEKTEAELQLKGENDMIFLNKGAPVQIPWAAIQEVEYGQKVGHRIKSAIFLSPVALFSKARHHFVTFAWADKEGKDQAAVFEFDKGDIRTALAVIHARTGKEIVYQDDEARKQMGGGATDKK